MISHFVYSHTLAASVQFLSQHTLWGQEFVEVYAPSPDRELTLPADNLLPLADVPLPSREERKGMNITGATGLTDAQRETLKQLGAIDEQDI